MKLPRLFRVLLLALCAANGCALLLGFARDWPLALCGALTLTIALCWLVRFAYAQGHHDGNRRTLPSCTMADVAAYRRKLNRAWPRTR